MMSFLPVIVYISYSSRSHTFAYFVTLLTYLFVYYCADLAVGDRWGCVSEYAEKHLNDCYIEFIPDNYTGVPHMEICRYEPDFISQSMIYSVVKIG